MNPPSGHAVYPLSSQPFGGASMADFPAAEFRMDGEPGSIRASGDRWTAFGAAATEAATQIRSLDSSLFVGPEGDQYRAGLDHDLPPHLDTTGRAYTAVGTCLTTYANALTGLQARMTPLRTRAPALWENLQQARGRVTSAQAADHQHLMDAPGSAAADNADPTAAGTYQSDLGAATTSLTAAEHAWNECLRAARAITADLRAAVDRADKAIRTAADLRFIHNPHGLHGLTSGFKNFVVDHAKGLSQLSGALKVVSGIAAVLSFIPVVGQAALAVSLLTAGAALLIDASLKYAAGKGSWASIAIDGALLALPFGIGKGIIAFRGARRAEEIATAGDDLAHLVGRPAGTKPDWIPRSAENGKGLVFQRPGATGNADMFRIADPTEQAPNGYVRFYNKHGQPMGLDGKPGSRDSSHFPIGPDGAYPLPEGW